MQIIEKCAAYIVPAVLLVCAFLMVKTKGGGKVFVSGAAGGLRCAASLIPTMVMLCVGLSMLCASGAVELFAKLVSPVTERFGIPADILPLILTIPVSGSASTAAYAKLLEECGPDSAAAVCASIIMGSSDTMIYVISVYCSKAAGVRSTRHAFPVATIVMIFCILLSCVLFRLMFD